MNALILAAGFGTRLRPHTHTIPKCLMPVNGTPLILYILALLKHHGIRDIMINLHHLGPKIQTFLGDGKKAGLTIHYSHEPKILGTGGGIKKALAYLKDPVLVINGDVIADFDLTALINQHREQRPYATIALHQNKDAAKYGLLHFCDSKLVSILGNPPPSPGSKSALYASFHILSKEQALPDLARFKPQEKFCIMRDVYIPQLTAGKRFGAYLIQGFWQVCDNRKDIARTEKRLNQKGFGFSYDTALKNLQRCYT